ncbi:deleted in malignant brain tumors 1 protein-like isoform X3 [Struthio camelus]|uniref:deleted in malignant brain tumors 1 protein-like isoform X3 n=1 Tax=Struthio camelus TaxID=8801 RepID=UPI0036041376
MSLIPMPPLALGCPCSLVSEPPQLRLVNGSGPCAGRVEVLHNEQWGTVCDDGWDLPDAEVVCWQLGCGAATSANGSAEFGRGSGSIWLTEVQCQGTEATLAACRAKPWGVHHCSHRKDASVVCAEPSEVRLVNGSGRCSGRVEVLHDQRWGSVCDDGWDLLDAEVVCRELGCGAALSAPGSARFGRGRDPIWLDGVSCTGTEGALSECRARPWGVHTCSHAEDAAVVCSDPTEVRLVNGSGRCSGRVEVLHDQRWGSVCDNDWDLLDAEVVCWYLGCGAALSAPGSARFGQGYGPFWLDRVHCTGREAALSECRAEPWGAHNCSHGEEASVVCAEPPALRLVNGSSPCTGRVEVLHNQTWGNVCAEGWDMQDAEVLCRELGCGLALSAPKVSHFWRGLLWLEGVNCSGMEDTLSECPAGSWGSHACAHRENAAVVCSELQLVNGSSPCMGRVEVLHNQTWGSMCAEGWDVQDAEVLCRELGCGLALSAPSKAHFGQGQGPIWLVNLSCLGTEATLSECPGTPWGVQPCHHREDVSVECSDPTELRLVNGSSPCMGRVEVLHERRWGSVCDHGWGMEEAEVVCRQLGCGPAISAPGQAQFGQGHDPIWMDELDCTGTEDVLSKCAAKPWGSHGCTHREDASVVCSEAPTIRLVNGSSRCVGRVEVLHAQRWGTVCDDDWKLVYADVVCRQLGCGAAVSALGSAAFGPGADPIWLDDVKCTGREAALSECRTKEWGEHNCDHGEDAGVVCTGTAMSSYIIPLSVPLLLGLVVSLTLVLLSGAVLFLKWRRKRYKVLHHPGKRPPSPTLRAEHGVVRGIAPSCSRQPCVVQSLTLCANDNFGDRSPKLCATPRLCPRKEGPCPVGPRLPDEWECPHAMPFCFAGNEVELNSQGTQWIQGGEHHTAKAEATEEPPNEATQEAKGITLLQDKPQGGREDNCSFLPDITS